MVNGCRTVELEMWGLPLPPEAAEGFSAPHTSADAASTSVARNRWTLKGTFGEMVKRLKIVGM